MVVGVQPQCLFLKGGPLGEPVLLRELAADQMVHLGIRRPLRQCRPARGRFTLLVVAEMRQHRPVGPGTGLPWD